MTHLYLVRHGETDWNAARRIQGSTDIPLNDVGREQARRTGRLLASRSWDLVVSSPLSRASETARIIAAELALPEPRRLDAIVERRYGEAEGLDYLTLHARFPRGVVVPGRESRDEVAARVLPALEELAVANSGRNVVVVTHGGVIRTVLRAVAPGLVHLAGVPITNGSVHSFSYAAGALDLVMFDDRLESAIAPGSAAAGSPGA